MPCVCFNEMKFGYLTFNLWLLWWRNYCGWIKKSFFFIIVSSYYFTRLIFHNQSVKQIHLSIGVSEILKVSFLFNDQIKKSLNYQQNDASVCIYGRIFWNLVWADRFSSEHDLGRSVSFPFPYITQHMHTNVCLYICLYLSYKYPKYRDVFPQSSISWNSHVI